MTTRGWIHPDAVGPGMKLDDQGRVVPNFSPDSFQYVDDDGYINEHVGVGLIRATGSPITLKSRVPDLSVPVTNTQSVANSNARAIAALQTGKSNIGHTHVESDVTGLSADLGSKQDTSEKGQPSGYASLSGEGFVPFGQTPFEHGGPESLTPSGATEVRLDHFDFGDGGTYHVFIQRETPGTSSGHIYADSSEYAANKFYVRSTDLLDDGTFSWFVSRKEP